MQQYQIRSLPEGDLCAPLDITQIYEPVYRCRSRQLDAFISLRPVCLPIDDGIITECALWEKEINGLGPQGNETGHVMTKKKQLDSIAASDCGQTFLGFIDEQPVFLAGIRKSQQDMVFPRFAGMEGDFHLYIELPRHGDPDREAIRSLALIRAALSHFFSYHQVMRIVAQLNRNDQSEIDLFLEAGFIFLQESEPPFSLYFHSGRGYLDR